MAVGIIPNFKQKSIRKLATDFTDVFATKAQRHEEDLIADCAERN
jgi:hypothetical protein